MTKLAIPKILVVYADLIDGLRSHYARREGDDGGAAFSAVLAVGALFNLNASLIVVMIDLLANDKLKIVPWINNHRALVLCALIAVGIIHWLFAKKAGVYNRHGDARSDSWKRILCIYGIATACNFVGTMLVMVLTRMALP